MSQSIFAQITLQLQPRKYDILVNITDKYAPTYRVEIKELRDTSILVTPILFSHAALRLRKEEQEYYIQNIDHLSVRNNHRLIRNTIIGGLIGLGVGAIIVRTHGGKGHNTDDHFLWSPELEHAAYIVAATTAGIGLGVLTGMFRVKIPINGKKSLYAKNRKRLEKYIQY